MQQLLELPPDGVLLSTRSMLTGSSIGVVVRNDTGEPAQTELSVAYMSLGGWCEMTRPDETAGSMGRRTTRLRRSAGEK
jgi:hypothetical protein